MSSPSCRQFRELLGVYVLGAIEPAERGEVDAHLSGCQACREELAGLAVLPSMLRRVSVADAGRLTALGSGGEAGDDPAPTLLPRLLAAVSARRRRRRSRLIAAAAAALLIAAGTGAAVARDLGPHPVRPAALTVVTASTHGLGARVRYGSAGSGTAMWIQVSGFRPRTACQFWVVSATGQRTLAGGWTVTGTGDRAWYPARADLPVASVAGFTITSAGKVLLRIPAAAGRSPAGRSPAGNVSPGAGGYRS